MVERIARRPTAVGGRWQTGRVLLDELVTTTDTVTATRSRLAKVDALADLLGRLEPDEIAPAVGFLVGKARQGRVGVGWRGLAAAMGDAAQMSQASRSPTSMPRSTAWLRCRARVPARAPSAPESCVSSRPARPRASRTSSAAC